MSIITSGKLPPEQHAERSREHLDRYSPTLEEILGDDLRDIVIQDRERYFQYKLASYQPGSKEEEKERQRLEKRIRKAGHAAYYVHEYLSEPRAFWYPLVSHAAYYVHDYPRRIYTVFEKPLGDATLALNTVHEAAHAAHYRKLDSGGARRPYPTALQDIIIEGFAEYVSLEAFQRHYGLPAIPPVLEERRRWHKKNYEIYTREKVYRFHEYFKDGEIVVPEEKRSHRMKACLHKANMWLVRFSSGSPEEYCGAAGYTFFKAAADAGISAMDIIRNPPRGIESIIDPTEYIQEMTSWA